MKIFHWCIMVICLIVVAASFIIFYPKYFLGSISNVVTVSAIVPFAQTTTAITAASGGISTTVANNNEIIIIVPENFSDNVASVTIRTQAIASDLALSSVGPPSSEFRVASSTVFNLRAFVDSQVTMDSFDRPITISFHYTSADIEGLDESTLGIYHYHQSTWEKLDNCNINTNQKIITCTTRSFSMFALFAKPQSITVSSSTGGYGGRAGSSGGGGIISMVGNIINNVLQNSSNTANTPTPTVSKLPPFKNNLKVGDTSADVKRLQQFLNSHGYVISKSGLGSPNNETTLFGQKTKAALIKFQEGNVSILQASGLKKGTGIFGNNTRLFINNILQK